MLTAEYRIVLYAVALLIGLAIFAKVRSRGARQAILLIGSYALYATWGLWFAAVLLASTVMNFLLGQWLRRKPSALVLWIGIVCNLLLLGSFKYLPEFADSVGSLHLFSHIALPLGISFWTFQAMSYLFDLYRGEELDPSFLEFALYMAFFPVAISGPICRLPDMLPQFRSEDLVPRSDVMRGISRIATGALMMQLGQLLGRGILNAGGINAGFDKLTRWSGPDVWCLAFGYGLQLFFDFAGYSHVAIGAAKMLGFTVPENFARPFASTTPSIFWTRWHMSLSFWIRDYVFLPLATLRREIWWRNLALVISMVLFGIWHKATWCSFFGAHTTESCWSCIAKFRRCSSATTGNRQRRCGRRFPGSSQSLWSVLAGFFSGQTPCRKPARCSSPSCRRQATSRTLFRGRCICW